MKKVCFIFLLLVASCKGNADPDKAPVAEPEPVYVDTVKVPEPSLLDEEIDVQDIKKQLSDFTSGFLNRKRAKIYPDKKKNNYFGYYTLMVGDFEIVGSLTIYDSINPYIFEKTTDEFVEVNLFAKGIQIYDGKVEAGMPAKDLIKLMGNDYSRYNDSVLLYKRGNKTAFFKIKDSLITALRIGIYREGISADTILAHSKEGWR